MCTLYLGQRKFDRKTRAYRKQTVNCGEHNGQLFQLSSLFVEDCAVTTNLLLGFFNERKWNMVFHSYLHVGSYAADILQNK